MTEQERMRRHIADYDADLATLETALLDLATAAVDLLSEYSHTHAAIWADLRAAIEREKAKQR